MMLMTLMMLMMRGRRCMSRRPKQRPRRRMSVRGGR
jgi:hypothetical protein